MLLGRFAGGEVGFDEHHDADVVEQTNRNEVVGDEVERVEEVGECAENEDASGTGGFL